MNKFKILNNKELLALDSLDNQLNYLLDLDKEIMRLEKLAYNFPKYQKKHSDLKVKYHKQYALVKKINKKVS